MSVFLLLFFSLTDGRIFLKFGMYTNWDMRYGCLESDFLILIFFYLKFLHLVDKFAIFRVIFVFGNRFEGVIE